MNTARILVYAAVTVVVVLSGANVGVPAISSPAPNSTSGVRPDEHGVIAAVIPGENLKAFQVAYSDFQHWQALRPDQANIEHYDVYIFQYISKRQIVVKFSARSDPKEKPMIGDCTSLGCDRIYTIKMGTYRILNKFNLE